MKDLFSKVDRIRSYPLIWSHLLKKSLMQNFIILFFLKCLVLKKSSFKYLRRIILSMGLTNKKERFSNNPATVSLSL